MFKCRIIDYVSTEVRPTCEFLTEWRRDGGRFDQRCLADMFQVFDFGHTVVVDKVIVLLGCSEGSIYLICQVLYAHVLVVTRCNRLHQLSCVLQSSSTLITRYEGNGDPSSLCQCETIKINIWNVYLQTSNLLSEVLLLFGEDALVQLGVGLHDAMLCCQDRQHFLKIKILTRERQPQGNTRTRMCNTHAHRYNSDANQNQGHAHQRSQITKAIHNEARAARIVQTQHKRTQTDNQRRHHHKGCRKKRRRERQKHKSSWELNLSAKAATPQRNIPHRSQVGIKWLRQKNIQDLEKSWRNTYQNHFKL